MKPSTYLFPGTVKGWRADVPITEKIIWTAVAKLRSEPPSPSVFSPHTLRHSECDRTAQVRDFEDVIAIVDGRQQLLAEVQTSTEVFGPTRTYIAGQISHLLGG